MMVRHSIRQGSRKYTGAMVLALLICFIVATCATLFVVRSARLHSHLSGDNDLSGPQKFHAGSVPRVGGLGIVLGLAAGCTAIWLTRYSPARLGAMLLLCGMPAFIAGLVEDVTKNVSPRRRLLATALSAALAIWLVKAIIVRTDLPGIDWLVSFGIGSVLFTIFVVTGIANALNIIDGFNGLSSMCAMMMLAAVAYVSYQTNDPQIATLALLGAAAILGFFVWNFPNGLIFLGDGGAYFTGFYVAELSILLVGRNAEVSPLFPLLMCVYPIFETLFSIYRRKVVRGRPVGLPDGVHLHSLIYRRVMRWAVGDRAAKQLTRRNSMTSPYLWVLCMAAIIPSVLFWNNSVLLLAFIVMFGATYLALYSSIVRFKVPRWMVFRKRPAEKKL
jgi:UDP-N-acetylmuramyl pentapeptide phosphotransferase/UDP-N-acetylglucosamine-1-phosphate transferase